MSEPAVQQPYERGVPIRISNHALQRLQERWGIDVKHAYYEIQQALREGRYSAKKPAFARYEQLGRGKKNRNRTQRYVWDAGRARCYVLCQVMFEPVEAYPTWRRGWRCVTVIPASDRP